MPTSSSRPRLFVIWLTIFIDLMGFGIVMPILPYYAQRFGAHGLGYGALVGAFSLMQFLATALLGRLSDRVGRRPILLTTMLLNAAGYVLFAFAPSYFLLLLSRLVSGFAGGNISAAQAYVADITSAEDRSKGMGLIGMAFGLGFIVGPGIGVLAAHFGGHAGPGLVAAGLSIVNLVSAYWILPESLKEEHRSARAIWPFGHMAEALAHPELRALMLVWAIAPFAFAGYTVALPLWAAASLGWEEKQLGAFFVVVGTVAAVVQGGLFRLLTKRGDVRDGARDRRRPLPGDHRRRVRLDRGAGVLEQHHVAGRGGSGLDLRRRERARYGPRRGAVARGVGPILRSGRDRGHV